MKTLISAIALASLGFTQVASANDLNTAPSSSKEKFYVGAGLNHNRIDTSSFGGVDGKTNGFQVFGGYDYGRRNGIDIGFEAGIIQTGEFYDGSGEDADGVWMTAIIKKDLPEIKEKLSGIARLGYGMGGDDGLLMGFGAQYRLAPQVFIRLEYVNKDVSQSYQVNAFYHF